MWKRPRHLLILQGGLLAVFCRTGTCRSWPQGQGLQRGTPYSGARSNHRHRKIEGQTHAMAKARKARALGHGLRGQRQRGNHGKHSIREKWLLAESSVASMMLRFFFACCRKVACNPFLIGRLAVGSPTKRAMGGHSHDASIDRKSK
jgi:hypothetical protein